MDNENLIPSGPCFICNNSVIISEFRETHFQDEDFMAQFLFRKLFCFPEEACCQLMEKLENPPPWIYWCESCSVLMTEGKMFYDELTRLENKICCLKQNLEAKISASNQISEEKIQTTNEMDAGLTNFIRSLVMSNTRYEENYECKVEIKFENDPGFENQFNSVECDVDDTNSEYSNAEQDFEDNNDIESILCKSESQEPGSSQLKSNASPKSEATLQCTSQGSRKRNGKAAIKSDSGSENEDQFTSDEYFNKIESEHSKSRKKSVTENTSKERKKKNVRLKRKSTVLHRKNTSHVNSANPLEIYTCSTCCGQFLFESDLTTHQSICDQDSNSSVNKNFPCRRCKKEFSNRLELAVHLKIVHRVHKIYSCEICGKRFVSYSLVTKHERVHTGEKPYGCDKCEKAFSHQRLLTKHLKRHEESWTKPYKCSNCEKAFASKCYLLEHEKTHNEDIRCTVCAKKFSCSQNLIRHMKFHSGKKQDRPFVCSFCGRAFPKSYILKIHEQIHDTERPLPHICQFCGKKFGPRGSLIQHERIHTGENPYLCSFCQKCFPSILRLKNHERTHTGEPAPFQCSFCDKRFDRKTNLTTHERTHTGEKPYSCTICGKSFSHSSARKKHQQVVHDKEPGKYPCTICGKRFQGKIDLQRHENSHKKNF